VFHGKFFFGKIKKVFAGFIISLMKLARPQKPTKLFLPIYITLVNFTAKMMMIMMIVYSIEHIPKILLLSCLQ